MSLWTPPDRSLPTLPVITIYSNECLGLSRALAVSITSGTWASANRLSLFPVALPAPVTVSKMHWVNGATVGTDSVDIGLYRMTDMTTGRCDLIRSSGATLSANANVVQEVGTWKIAANKAALTADSDLVDRSTYTTASVTLKAGRLYLMSVLNVKTATDPDVISSITGGPIFTSRATTMYGATADNRVSL